MALNTFVCPHTRCNRLMPTILTRKITIDFDLMSLHHYDESRSLIHISRAKEEKEREIRAMTIFGRCRKFVELSKVFYDISNRLSESGSNCIC